MSSPRYQSQSSYSPTDVMISYSHQEKSVMSRVTQTLEEAGVSVWVDKNLKTGDDFLRKIGQAIVDAKAFISILSTNSVESKYCQDELALAYISNKPIFPLALQPQKTLLKVMDTGMRLQLARYKWYFVDEELSKSGDMKLFVHDLKKALTDVGNDSAQPAQPDIPEDEEAEGGTQSATQSGTQRPVRPTSAPHGGRPKTGRARLNKRTVSHTEQGPDLFTSSTKRTQKNFLNTFWSRNFPDDAKVTWKRFFSQFESEYSEELEMIFRRDEDRKTLIQILRRELGVRENGDQVYYDSYVEFCTYDAEVYPVWYRVQDELVANYTMREVFSMNSTVRIDAIQTLSKFKSQAVIQALYDLLSDTDPNTRAVAAISLAKTGVRNNSEITENVMLCLKDDDRLVRESACIALGYMKADKAVPRLNDVWRNDTISSVRNAALEALKKIGGRKADEIIHMTDVLIKEMKTMAESSLVASSH